MAKVLWTQKQDIGPRPRAAHAMTFDSVRRRVVLFGGDSLGGTLFGDTWEWDSESWTQVQDIGPGARAFHAMAFDTVRRRVVLFGGRDSAAPLGDTWEWDGEAWTQVADSGPVSRSGHAMAFDSTRRRIVVFGGASASGRLNDTWEWDGNEWVQQGDSGPSPRIHAAMAYDSRRNRLVLFGGASENAGLGDTWEWDGEAWTEESDFGPDACAGGGMVFKGGRIALFGGISSLVATAPPPAVFSRSWEWDGRHWTARQDMGPGPRVFHAMAFDAPRSRVVLFGGSPVIVDGEGAAGAVRGDTWEQFEEGSAAGGEIAGIVVTPNPAQVGSTVVVTVTLAAPAPGPGEMVILFDGQPVATISIEAGATDAAVEIQVDPGLPPTAVIVTARLGASEASTSLSLVPAIEVDLLSLEADPNPVSPGNTVRIIVTLTAPTPAAALIALEVEGEPLGDITVAAGAISGEVQIQIPDDVAPMTVTLTARSGASAVSVALTIA